MAPLSSRRAVTAAERCCVTVTVRITIERKLNTSHSCTALRVYTFEKKGADSKYRFTIEAKDTIVYNPHKGNYGRWELTKLGKTVCRKLSMNLFAQVQEPLMYGKLIDLEI